MLFSDNYFEPIADTHQNLREKGSKFLAFLYPVKLEEEIKKHLQELKSKYPDATHHCYAWVLHPDKSAQRSSDDGEPSGSAGKPILRAILSSGLTNVLVVVVRYFGGTQLGIPGLIKAYGDAAKLATAEAYKIEKYVEDIFEISATFEHENEIHRMIQLFGARILNRQYGTKVSYEIAVRQSVSNNFSNKCTNNYLLNIELKN